MTCNSFRGKLIPLEPKSHLSTEHRTAGAGRNIWRETSFAWSRDGKEFFITRARYNDADVVMFTGFR